MTERIMLDKIPLDPGTKVIQIRPQKHSLRKKSWHEKKFNPCHHNQLVINEDRGVVTCETCAEEMSPLKAIVLLCSKIWWEQNAEERRIEIDEKRVAKVQTAAIEHLYAAGMTPEKYAARWERERQKRAEAEIKKATAELAPTAAAGKGPAA